MRTMGKGLYGGKLVICNKCNKEKPVDDFYKRDNSTTGYRKSCKDCLRKQKVMRLYKLCSEEYDELHSDMRCHICNSEEQVGVYGKVKELSVDHCHTTGKVRGLLCQSCNVGLGAFKDNVNSLQRAIDYLKEKI